MFSIFSNGNQTKEQEKWIPWKETYQLGSIINDQGRSTGLVKYSKTAVLPSSSMSHKFCYLLSGQEQSYPQPIDETDPAKNWFSDQINKYHAYASQKILPQGFDVVITGKAYFGKIENITAFTASQEHGYFVKAAAMGSLFLLCIAIKVDSFERQLLKTALKNSPRDIFSKEVEALIFKRFQSMNKCILGIKDDIRINSSLRIRKAFEAFENACAEGQLGPVSALHAPLHSQPQVSPLNEDDISAYFEVTSFDELSEQEIETIQLLADANIGIKKLWERYLQKHILGAKTATEASKLFAAARNVETLQLPPHADDAWLACLAEKAPSQLTSLSLADCKKITDLSALGQLTMLQSLDLAQCEKISHASLAAVNNFKNLKHLNMVLCKNFDEAILLIISQMTQLESLNISALNIKDVNSLGLISKLNNLKHLYLKTSAYCKNLAFLAQLTQLESLEVVDFISLNDYSSLASLGKLKKLVIARCPINGGFLHSIGLLTDLEELSFGSRVNSITKADLPNLANLKKLKSLASSWIVVDDQDLSLFAELTSLESLSLSSNSLSGQGLQYLHPLKSLKSLSLGGNKALTDAGFAYIKMLPALESISCVEGHSLTDTSLDTLAAMPNLRELCLTRCDGFTNEGFKKLAPLTKLQKLELRQTKIVDLTPLKDLSLLSYLDLLGCNIETIDPLQQLPLKYLNLSTCWKLIKSGLSALTALPELESLDLSRDKVVDHSVLQHIKKMGKLIYLNLSDCALSSSDLEPLASLVSLIRLELGDNQNLDDSCLAHLKSLTGLQSLNLSSNKNITEKGFTQATQFMHALTHYQVDFNIPVFMGKM